VTPQRLRWGLVCALSAAALTPSWSERFPIAISRLRSMRVLARGITSPNDLPLHALADELIDAGAPTEAERRRERRATSVDRLGRAQRLAVEHLAELMAVQAQSVEDAAAGAEDAAARNIAETGAAA
jgi:hypothetical protein